MIAEWIDTRKLKARLKPALLLLYRIPPESKFELYRKRLRRKYGFYFSPSEIADDMVKTMPEGFRSFLLAAQKHDLPQAHNSMGQYLRNTYGLWEEENPHTLTAKDEPVIEGGVVTDLRHPDNLSYRILNDVRHDLQLKAAGEGFNSRIPRA